MKSVVADWIEGYALRLKYVPETIRALKMVNTVMAVFSAVVGALFIGPSSLFMRPMTPPDEWWISLAFWQPGIEVWDFVFILGAIALLLSTASLNHIAKAHSFLAFCWFILGALWVIGGIFAAPSYLFGAGVFALFISALHASMIRIWKAEGVN